MPGPVVSQLTKVMQLGEMVDVCSDENEEEEEEFIEKYLRGSV